MTLLTINTNGNRLRAWITTLAVLIAILIVLVIAIWFFLGSEPDVANMEQVQAGISGPVPQINSLTSLAVLMPDVNRQVAVILSDKSSQTLHVHISDFHIPSSRQLVLWEFGANGQPRALGPVSDGTALPYPASGLTTGARLVLTLEDDSLQSLIIPRGPVLMAGALRVVDTQ